MLTSAESGMSSRSIMSARAIAWISFMTLASWYRLSLLCPRRDPSGKTTANPISAFCTAMNCSISSRIPAIAEHAKISKGRRTNFIFDIDDITVNVKKRRTISAVATSFSLLFDVRLFYTIFCRCAFAVRGALLPDVFALLQGGPSIRFSCEASWRFQPFWHEPCLP